MPLLNFFGLFVIIGIGCDGTFLITNTYYDLLHPSNCFRAISRSSVATGRDIITGDIEMSSLEPSNNGEGDIVSGSESDSEIEAPIDQSQKGRLCSFFRQVARCLGSGPPPPKRDVLGLAEVYQRAGGALLAATTTTAGSFFANVASSLPVLREFGIFGECHREQFCCPCGRN